MSQERINKFRAWIAEQGLDAFLVTQPQNSSYLSGWLNDEEGAAWLLVGQQQQVLLTNYLYKEVAEREAVGWQVVIPPGRDYSQSVASLAQEHGWKKIGFESMAVRYGQYEKLRAAADGSGFSITLQPFEHDYIQELRQVKQPEEIDLLKRAIAITDETFAHICNWIQPGMTEKEVQWEISRKFIELGAEDTAFSSIVASGPNGSMPHAVPGERRIQPGELITIDMGARYKGYCADMTRTICLGEPAEPRMRELYDAVVRSLEACEQGLHAGIGGREA
ncbi:MAG TPA: Xaa-Pro peptidase family protein, partial [Ktedonobacteraceae bacterium]|nr:Xaa-Pro peptidase family protein [Ktedonobacteraceae bacterium]